MQIVLGFAPFIVFAPTFHAAIRPRGGAAKSTGPAGVPARKLCHQRRLGVRLGDRRFRGSGDGICAWRSDLGRYFCARRGVGRRCAFHPMVPSARAKPARGELGVPGFLRNLRRENGASGRGSIVQ
jgi:hypothetical protein